MKKISEILKEKFTISLEFFPPKDEAGDKQLWQTVEDVKNFRGGFTPDFYTVTFGAGGSSKAKTFEVAKKLHDMGFVTMEHLTCYGMSKTEIENLLSQLEQSGIVNILALRGDRPANNPNFVYADDSLKYASELVEFIRERNKDFDIGVASYPEGHSEAISFEDDLKNFKTKVDMGANFAITQLFLDNKDYFNYIERITKMGIDIPVIPGMLPIISYHNIMRFNELCGTKIPKEMLDVITKHKDDNNYIR